MARSARLVLPGNPHHIFHQGNNRQQVFYDDGDRLRYLDYLEKASRQYQVDIHAYVLLDSSVHLLATPVDAEGLARMMQWMGRCYVPYFNRRYGHSGTLWEGRFRTSVVEAEPWLMKCCRFIEMRPVVEGLVEKAEEYRWSSYSHHVGTHYSSIIRDSVLYWRLGNTPFARESAYLSFMQAFSQEEDAYLEQVLTKGWPLGGRPFIAQLEKLVGRPFRMGRRGRPARKTA